MLAHEKESSFATNTNQIGDLSARCEQLEIHQTPQTFETFISFAFIASMEVVRRLLEMTHSESRFMSRTTSIRISCRQICHRFLLFKLQ
jgi:hypothetical protein